MSRFPPFRTILVHDVILPPSSPPATVTDDAQPPTSTSQHDDADNVNPTAADTSRNLSLVVIVEYSE
jgi:hypothetical protein